MDNVFLNIVFERPNGRVVFLLFDSNYELNLNSFGDNDFIYVFNAPADLQLRKNTFTSDLLNVELYIDNNLSNVGKDAWHVYEGWHSWPFEFRQFDRFVQDGAYVSKAVDLHLLNNIEKLEEFILSTCSFATNENFSGCLKHTFFNKFLSQHTRSEFLKITDSSRSNYYYSDAPSYSSRLLHHAEVSSEGVVVSCVNDLDFLEVNYDLFVWKKIEKKNITLSNYRDSISKYTHIKLDNDFVYVNLLSHFGRYVYGHFFDIMAKVGVLSELDRYVFLINHHPRNLINDIEFQLSSLGIRNVLKVPVGSVINVDKLINIPMLSYPSQISKTNQFFISKKYFNYLDRDDHLTSKFYRIYLTRNSNNSSLQMTGSRNVVNEDQLISMLKSRGFIILTGNEDLRYIVKIFSRCQVLVSMHGSGIRNMIYSELPNYIIELYPSLFKTSGGRGPDTTIANLCLSKNSIYKQLVLESDNEFNVCVDLNLLSRYLDVFV